MRKIIKYQLPNGKIPFDEWFSKLDKTKQYKCIIRLQKCTGGFWGTCRKLKKGIIELKFKTGERIYIADMKDCIILLLLGGGKIRQSDDIKKAEKYLLDYQRSSKNE